MIKLRKSLIEEIIIKSKLDPSIKKLYTSKSKDLALDDLNNILLKILKKIVKGNSIFLQLIPDQEKQI